MPEYMKIQKSPYYKDYLKCPKIQSKNPILLEWPEIQGPKEGKLILIFIKISGPNLGPWAQKSILRFIRTLGPSSAALAQSSWSLLSNTLGG